MRMKGFLGITAIVAALTLPVPALAQRITADRKLVIAELAKRGYETETFEGSQANSIRIREQGVPVTIFFLNCGDGKKGCTTIQLFAGFTDIDATLAQINDWNMNQRWGRAYIDRENDPVVEMDVNMDYGGLDRELFWDNVVTFFQVIRAFAGHLKK